MSLYPVANHTNGTRLLHPPVPPPPTAATFSVCSLHTEVSGGMAAVQALPRHKYVTDRAAGVGEVTSLQNHYRVLHVEVHKVNPKIFTHRRLTLAALHWEPYIPGISS